MRHYSFKILLVILVLLFSAQVSAHVKWFVPLCGTNSSAQYSWTDPIVLFGIAFYLCLIFFAIIADKYLPGNNIFGDESKKTVFKIFNIFVGASLVASAANGNILAAHYVANSQFSYILLYIEAIAGLMLLANRYIFLSSLLLILLFFGSAISFGVIEVLDYINIFGIAIFLLINSLPTTSHRQHYSHFAIPTLRVFSGIALIVLALSEKLLNPNLAASFLNMHHWNFMHEIGFDFITDNIFILIAGMVELAIGTILILGVAIRATTLVLAGLLLISNITFLFLGNYAEALTEIVGHLPILATGILLIAFGAGEKFKLANTIFLNRIKKDRFPGQNQSSITP